MTKLSHVLWLLPLMGTGTCDLEHPPAPQVHIVTARHGLQNE